MKKYYIIAILAISALIILALFEFGVIKNTLKVAELVNLPTEEVTEETGGKPRSVSPVDGEEKDTETIALSDQSASVFHEPLEPAEAVEEITGTHPGKKPPRLAHLPDEESPDGEKKELILITAELKEKLIKFVSNSPEENEINRYLENLTKEKKIDNSIKEHLSRMIFWRNFDSLQSKPSCASLDQATELFDLEKELKSTWFTTQGMGFIMSKEITLADRKWIEMTAECGSQTSGKAK